MAIIKCSNGHFYDDVIYRGKCPHCKVESELLKTGKTIEEDDQTVAMEPEQINLHTGNYDGDISYDGDSSLINPTSFLSDSGSMSNKETKSERKDAPTVLLEDSDKKELTQWLNDGTKTLNLVTGWLVCVNGTEKGKDYHLHAGKNFIGRSIQMDIVIVNDKTVARDRHCVVIHEPKNNTFYVAGESGNVVYLNGETVENFAEIKENDVVRVGKTEMLFVPYCKEGRQWNE